MFFITTLVLLFLLKIRFPHNQPFSDILRRRYGVPVLHSFRNLEKSLRRRDKLQCDIEYLQACLHYKVIPKFLRIKLYKRSLENTAQCRSYQTKLLQSELRYKERQLKIFDDRVDQNRTTLSAQISCLDSSCVNLWLRRKQENVRRKIRTTHSSKLHRLGISPIAVNLEPEKVLFNYSNYTLSNTEKEALLLGLDFNLPIKSINFFKYFFSFEKLYSTFEKLDIHAVLPNATESFKKNIRCIANKYYYNFKPFKNNCPLFNKSLMQALKSLSSNRNIYITKPDKGQGVVILNRNEYNSKVLDIINDANTFSKICMPDQQMTIKLEDKLNNQLRKLKSSNRISETFYSTSYASGSKIGHLYGLPKVHKPNCPIRPILSACSAHNFQLGKALIPLISHLATNEYTLNNSKEFATSIQCINNANSLYMCSFDIVSLYTNIPVQESIDLILDTIYSNGVQYFKGLEQSDFKKLLDLALKDSYFKFNNALYKQTAGLAMGSAISPLIANVFLNHFETSILENCPTNIKPKFYRRYLDDTFLLFENENQARSFLDFINSKHQQITFTFEGENEQCLSFLDVTVKRSNNKFITSVFRKTTFSGLGTNYFSNTAMKYKISSIITLLHRAYNICSTFALFHDEVLFLKTYFTNNCYPSKLFNCLLKKFLNSKYDTKAIAHTVSKQKVYVHMPFIGTQSEKLLSEVKMLLSTYYPQIQPCFYFKNHYTIGSFFKRYDQPEMLLRSNIVYKYACHCCQQCYIGSTQLQMFRRAAQHKGVSFRTNRPLSKPDLSAIRDHCNERDHPFKIDNFCILDTCHTRDDLKLMESIHIQSQKPELNRNKLATQLHILS